MGAYFTPKEVKPLFAYIVHLQSRGNPDLGQDPRDPQSPGSTVGVADFVAASQACRDYIGRWALGGGNWTGGAVSSTQTGRIVARVSYNGRVWSTTEKDANGEDKLLFDPFNLP